MLHLAAMYGLKDLVADLLTDGKLHPQTVDIIATDLQGQTALQNAIYYRQPQIIDVLLRRAGQEQLTEYDNEGLTLLQRAHVRESYECLVGLLEMGSLEYLLVKSEFQESTEEMAKGHGLDQILNLIVERIKNRLNV